MLDLLRRHRVDVIICTGSTSGPHHGAPGGLRRHAEELDPAAEELLQSRNAVMRTSALARGRGWILVLVTGSFRIVGEIRSMILEQVHRLISGRHTAVGDLADFQGASNEHTLIRK
jgi:hypothetical protein